MESTQLYKMVCPTVRRSVTLLLCGQATYVVNTKIFLPSFGSLRINNQPSELCSDVMCQSKWLECDLFMLEVQLFLKGGEMIVNACVPSSSL